MEYFRQDSGRYISKGVPGMPGGSPLVRMFIFLVPILVLGGIYINASKMGSNMGLTYPFLIFGVIFIFNFGLAAVLRKKGHGAGMVVDQMKGTITYKRPGGTRQTVPISSIDEIGFLYSGGDMYDRSSGLKGGAAIYLHMNDDRKISVAYSRKPDELKLFADEMSIITSLTVKQYTKTAAGT